MPFVTAGDPDLEFTSQVVKELCRQGCSLCELGIPYSDPIADGPVIQASYTRALEKGVKLDQIFNTVSSLGSEVDFPLVSMVSYAIVYRHGMESFVSRAKESGFHGAIVPDLLVDEADEMAAICRKHDFSLIQLVTPTTPRDRAVRIAESSTGFLYYVSITGITGERTELPPQIVDQVGWLREQTDLPICIGFGISRTEHVRMLSPVADGLIVGSAIVKRISETGEKDRASILSEIGQFVSTLISELNNE